MTDTRALAHRVLADHAECSGCEVEELANAHLASLTENAELKRQLEAKLIALDEAFAVIERNRPSDTEKE